MVVQSAHNFIPLGITEFILQFFKSEVHYVMVVDFFGGNIIAQFEPDAVEKVDFLRCQVRGVRPEIEHMLLPTREINDER